MFRYSSASFYENGVCVKCVLFATMEAKLSEFEELLRTMKENSLAEVACQAPVASVGQPSITPVSHSPAGPKQLGCSTEEAPGSPPTTSLDIDSLSSDSTRFSQNVNAPTHCFNQALNLGLV